MRSLKSIELFAGAGGLAIGAARAGFEPVKVVEFNKACRATLSLNKDRANGSLRNLPLSIDEDVRDQDYKPFEGKVDMVSGGPPCQPFSMGGRHNAQADQRDMFPEAVRAVREARPKAFLFENVKGLTRESFAAYFEYIRLQLNHPHVAASANEDWADHLERLQNHHTCSPETADDYRVVTQVMNAADYGIPQQRHRVFFVGVRSDLGQSYSFPRPTHSRAALVADIASGLYMERTCIRQHHLSIPAQLKRTIENAKPLSSVTVASAKPWKTVRETFADMPAPQENGVAGWYNHLKRSGAKSYPGHTGSYLDYPAKALKAGVHGVPGGENMMRHANGRVRYFTVRESARLQTFPDDYEVTGSWSEAMRQLGNAVPVDLAHVVAAELRKTLSAA